MTHIELYQSELDRFAYCPENMDEEARARPYRFDDLKHITDDDLRVATLLYWQCCEPDAWAFPETYHQENMDIGEYYFTEHGYELNPEYYAGFTVEIVDDTEPNASTWTTSYKEAGTPSDCREPLLYGFWDVRKD